MGERERERAEVAFPNLDGRPRDVVTACHFGTSHFDRCFIILLCVSVCFGSFSGKNRRHISVEILLQVHLPSHAAFLELTSLLGQAVWKRGVYIDSSNW